MRLLPALLVLGSIVGLASPAAAQMTEVNLDRGPASELYLRKRPPTSEAPILAPELKELRAYAEQERDGKRIEAIAMLREFLNGKPEGSAEGDGQFKL